ncbi:zinc-dependent dehydrogenase [Syntrophobacter fumaroxidans]|uniref:Alcohol dehydrogenase GroES domain protein n=1 Tax=Syntrophobacter fumaroxidans (strain DSM 10017 / MPOB) TaxID=335543 RepID=A0LL41_SYNFM|nr:zinc-dependent dehydrogenase [Syntrophobacter fumaroxidans]ABK18143.1 Alcohol dehydrogenase GroES domain protein [Syntrophobacter fumaroxidans MPOB]
MKVSYWHSNNDIRIEEVATPRPGPKEMLLKVASCGICGSDVVEWYRKPRAPLVQGHEIGAEVVEVGSSVTGFKVGERVFAVPKVPCMECHYCRNGHYPQCAEIKVRLPGGFAEYILVPEILVEKGTYHLPDTITYDQSTFIEPLACVVRAQRLAGIRAGQTVVVLGCGMSGLLHVKLAKARDCRVVAADVNRKRLAFAEQLGADLIVDAAGDVSESFAAAGDKKADAVMICTSAVSAVEQAWRCVDKGGAIVFFAVPGPGRDIVVPVNDFWTREIRILTSYYCGPPDIDDALKLLESGRIEVEDMITHRLPLRDIAKGFQLVIDANESIKVIIKPNEI